MEAAIELVDNVDGWLVIDDEEMMECTMMIGCCTSGCTINPRQQVKFNFGLGWRSKAISTARRVVPIPIFTRKYIILK